MPMSYFIKPEYYHRDHIVFFDDTTNTDNYQNEIYRYAKEIFVKNNYNKVLDIGCGSGFKLVKYFNENESVGSDLQPTVNFLRQKYPTRRWETYDFNAVVTDPFDLVLCVDVIEHVLDPDVLVKFIQNLNFKKAIISTPERDRMGHHTHRNGPPINPCHVREWNYSEFFNYMSSNFKVIEHPVFANHDQFVVIEKQ